MPGADGAEPLAADAARAHVRALPTHALLYDSDAGKPAVAGFLARHGYAPRPPGGFFHALHGADAHSEAEREPARVLIYEHQCWTDIAGG